MPKTVVYVTDALADYDTELGSLGLAPNTIAGYRGYLARFGRICDQVAREPRSRSRRSTRWSYLATSLPPPASRAT